MSKRKHAVIAGTGRAGTSFLVSFLNECGLPTSVAEGSWFGRARAGFEQSLDTDESLPYVVKDPWLFAYYEQLDLDELQIDALILPMRNLMDAAQSRVHQERMSLVEISTPERPNAQVAGRTPAGVLYSLDVVDQARILAVGFHNLLHWGVANSLPVFLPSFPQMVEDVDYLLDMLWPWLGEHCSKEDALRAFANVAAPGAVRVRELTTPRAAVLGPSEPDHMELRNAALVERIGELEDASRSGEREREKLLERVSEREDELRRLTDRADELARALAATEQRLAAARNRSLWGVADRVARNRSVRRMRRVVRRVARLLER